jgi:hypothetical protein
VLLVVLIATIAVGGISRSIEYRRIRSGRAPRPRSQRDYLDYQKWCLESARDSQARLRHIKREVDETLRVAQADRGKAVGWINVWGDILMGEVRLELSARDKMECDAVKERVMWYCTTPADMWYQRRD